jgi:adenylate cyclase
VKLLTSRQLEVLELMAKGLTNREIGRVLGISPGTAKLHVSAVIEALDVTNRTEAATRLHELGLGTGRGETRGEFTVAGFGTRPAVAVLPFDSFSSDPEQEFLADGIVEDLISRLACWRWLPVIARNSTFAYKGKSADVREVSRALGARHVVEGSVRPIGERLRVSVQLLDGESGEHVWANRYDCELAEVPTLADEIVDTIVASLEPAIIRIQGLRTVSRRPENLAAWECLQRGFVRLMDGTWEGVLASGPLFERALELDPRMARACASLAMFEIHTILHQRAADPAQAEERALVWARRAVELDPAEPFAHVSLGWALAFAGRTDEAIDAHERALELNPSSAWAHWAKGVALCAGGRRRLDEGIAALEKGLRLSPHDPFAPFITAQLGGALLTRGSLEEAREVLERGQRAAPELPHGYPVLAALHVARGDLDEARACLARMTEVDPGYSPLAHVRRFLSPRGLRAYAATLAAAGWREEEPDGAG